MKILSSVIDPRMGGPQRRSLSVAESLKDRGIQTVFHIPIGDDSFADEATTRGFDVRRTHLPRIRPPREVGANGRFLRTFFQTTDSIQTIMRETDVDVIHANMAINYQTALAADRADVPLAWHFNDTLTPAPVKQVSAAAAQRWADEVVVAADAVHEYFFTGDVFTEQFLSGEPFRNIYAPVDLAEFDPATVSVDETALRAELGIDQSVPVVGTVGNINPIKGHDTLLKAIGEVVDDRNVVVPVVGKQLETQEMYYEHLLNIRSRLGLNDVVTFVGFRSDVPELLSLFDVFVLPSRAEACPIVVLEAMAMECPVVATDVGGVTEQLPGPNFGRVVPPTDPTELAAAIINALDSPTESRRRAENARDRVESMFSLEACVDRHESLYRTLADEDGE